LQTEPRRERAVLVALELTGQRSRVPADVPAFHVEESIDELETLASSAGAEVVDRVIQRRSNPEAATLIGSGKVEELVAATRSADADLVIFDNELSPTQQRNLERALDVRLIDRTQLILDIFARRARTREGQLQVELAQLSYLLPRLTGRGIEMSRLGGGIGTRGPGETQLETDRRKISKRIKSIQDELKHVRAGRSIQRRQRQSVPLATIALVGYTNAGKSTLFNRLTGAHVTADARMFATLDPTVRHITLPSNRRVLLSDTVGFIRNLPTTLVQAFRATLEEVVEAELLLHVVDVSGPHAANDTAHVFRVLTEIGADDTPQILVMNKVDLLPEPEVDIDATARRLLSGVDRDVPSKGVALSAKTGEGADRLLAAVDRELALDPVTSARFRLPVDEGAALHLLHERARVTSTKYTESYCEVEAEVPESIRRRLTRFVIDR
jgi:GTP-binding protein HflX